MKKYLLLLLVIGCSPKDDVPNIPRENTGVTVYRLNDYGLDKSEWFGVEITIGKKTQQYVMHNGVLAPF